MYFDKPYNRTIFLNLLQSKIFPTFMRKEERLSFWNKTAYFVENWIYRLWTVNLDKEISVLEIEQKSSNDPRITLTKDAFKILEYHGIDHAIIIFHCKDTSSYRLSLLTVNYENRKKRTSSYKRYSYILWPNEKVKTPEKELLHQIKDYEDLTNRFKVEVVRNQFFDEYLELFVRLYKAIQEDIGFVELLQSQNKDVVSFTKNLLGKIIFLYFIQKKWWLWLWRNTTTKYWEWNRNFMRVMWNDFKNNELMSTEKTWYFYNDYLEWLFFAWLNVDRRDQDDWFPNLKMKVPYLNGWLFKEEYTWWESYVTKIDNWIFSNIDTKGEDDADWILDIFDRYNFTIDEDSLYDRDIAVDPEMLGRIFEKMISISSKNIKEVVELYDGMKAKWKWKFDFWNKLNKDLWAFYTPREIVHYMTQECLSWYLQTKTKATEEEISKLFELKEDFMLDRKELNESWFSSEFLQNIDEALKQVKVLDPAVWSWAYPMWLLHEISGLRYYLYWAFHSDFWNTIDEFETEEWKISLYKIKKDIILNNIYWVDIDPGAIDIAKLRFWLSLVVDAQEPEPLPNFEFKFVCANSLVSLADETKEKDLFATWDEPKLETLKKYKRDFYNASSLHEKKDLKERIVAYTKIENTLFSQPTLRARQIEEFGKNFDNPKHTHSFFDASLMFSEWRWFDIIIANPPYIWEKWHKDIFREVAESKLWKFYMWKMDYFYFFFHLALDLWKNNSLISFITTNYYLTADWAKNLRIDFKERSTIKKLINFNELKIFESALWQHNIITILQKWNNKNQKSYNCLVHRKWYFGNDKNCSLNAIFNWSDKQTEYFEIEQSNLYEGDNCYIRIQWTNEKSTNNDIIYKMQKWTLLFKICNINQWIVTWIDDAFVIDNNSPLYYDSIAVPFYKNSDIVQYWSIQETDNKILYVWRDCNNISKNIETHLIKYKSVLDWRREVENWKIPWFQIWWPRKKQIFNSPKIICPQRNAINKFGYNECEWYAASDVFFITTKESDINLKYILWLLNSKLYYFWLYNKWKRKWETLELTAKPLSEIPIKEISLEEQQTFINLVDKIIEIKKDNLESNTSDLEKQIDQLVYKLYWLTDEEIQIVEESVK